MNRPYSVDDFKKVVKRFRQEIPEMTFSTDIICGFPNETKEQFMQSVALIKETMPDVLNISRFVPRRGTIAAKMEGQLQINEKKERSAYLTEVHKWVAFERNRLWRNWKGEIIIDEIGAKDNAIFGRNFAYKIFAVGERNRLTTSQPDSEQRRAGLVEGNFKLGQKINVKVVSMSPHCLIAQVLE